MANAKTLKTLTLASYQVTPNDQWVFPTKTLKNTRETNLNKTKTTIVVPAEGTASGPIRVPSVEVLKAIQDSTGWELKAEFYDGTALVMSDCAEVTDGEFSTAGGVIELEIDGIPDFI